MKQNVYNIGLLAVAGFSVILTGCSNDFDFDEARRENPEFAYKENFEKAFGKIDPAQSWDFTTGATYSGSSTRATRAISSQTDFNAKWSTGDDWYEVPSATITELQNTLPEDVNNISKGHKFICIVPDCAFSLTPVFQGRNPMNSSYLEMTVTYNGESKTYKIWDQKEEDQKETNGGTNAVLIQKTYCPTCHGDGLDGTKTCQTCKGTGGAWTPANHNSTNEAKNSASGLSGTTTGKEGNYKKATKGIRARRLRFAKGDLPAGATLTFHARSKYLSSSTPKDYYSSPANNNTQAYILAVNSDKISRPTNVPTGHEYLFISSEAGWNNDLNDIVLMFEGDPYVPQEFNSTEEEFDITERTNKRYMVEDLGATEESDIDFNDLVVDFKQTKVTHYKYKVTTGSLGGSSESVPQPDGDPIITQSVEIKALGGTKNISLYVKNGTTPNPTSDPCIFIKDGTAPVSTSFYNSPMTSSGFTAKYMYNTVATSQTKFINYVLNYDSSITLASINLSSDILWKPGDNNVYVVVAGDESEGLTYDSSGRVIEFPDEGTVPAMIAVDINQAWNWERANVFKEPNASTGNMLQLIDGTTNNWKDYPTK